ncbi:DUF6777 domain-containing protein [Streptomyces fradiae]|uniref:DUF6777 domain-containing protein n=1 Tax=Streptomyces fradiae TaxID=1906 RepID=UPI001330709E|nr:DUF6777 domain-containing protein [Streptomyces fradiae]
MRPPTRRPSVRPRHPYAAAAAALAGLLAAGCGGDGGRPAARPSAAAGAVPLLQPAAAPGPSPFTASTVLTADRAARPAAPSPSGSPPPSPSGSGGPSAPAGAAGAPAPRTVDGATPGLYGGTHSLPSCDVDQQARLLAADTAKSRAFAQAAGVTPSGLGAWLRGLTPVMLRADTRVTGHGYRDGKAVPYQAVLQTGTAVLVDAYGAPRVRCAAGAPLRTAAQAPPATAYRGEPWPGFRPDRVVLVSPTRRALESLLVVNVFNETWLERATGSRGDRDREPAVPPAYEAARHVADAPVAAGAGAGSGSAAPPGGAGRSAVPPPPATPSRPSSPPQVPEPAPEPDFEPDSEPDAGGFDAEDGPGYEADTGAGDPGAEGGTAPDGPDSDADPGFEGLTGPDGSGTPPDGGALYGPLPDPAAGP